MRPAAVAGGVPLPAVDASALRHRAPSLECRSGHGRGSLPSPPRGVAPRRERLLACRAPAQPCRLRGPRPHKQRPLRRGSGRQADWSANNGAGPLIRCVAGPCDARGVDCFGHAGTPFPPRLLGATNCGRQYARHSWITKGFCLAALAAAALQGELRPVTTGSPRPHPPSRNGGAVFCNEPCSDGTCALKRVNLRFSPLWTADD